MKDKSYLQGKADERRRIKGLLELDLLILDAQNPKELVARAVQLIENEPLESEDPSGVESEGA